MTTTTRQSDTYEAAYAAARAAGKSEHDARWDAACADVRAERAAAIETFTAQDVRDALPGFRVSEVTNTDAVNLRSFTVGPGRADEAAQVLAEAGFHVFSAPQQVIPVNPWNAVERRGSGYTVHLYCKGARG